MFRHAEKYRVRLLRRIGNVEEQVKNAFAAIVCGRQRLACAQGRSCCEKDEEFATVFVWNTGGSIEVSQDAGKKIAMSQLGSGRVCFTFRLFMRTA